MAKKNWEREEEEEEKEKKTNAGHAGERSNWVLVRDKAVCSRVERDMFFEATNEGRIEKAVLVKTCS